MAVKTTKWGLFRRLCPLVGAQIEAIPNSQTVSSRTRVNKGIRRVGGLRGSNQHETLLAIVWLRLVLHAFDLHIHGVASDLVRGSTVGDSHNTETSAKISLGGLQRIVVGED